MVEPQALTALRSRLDRFEQGGDTEILICEEAVAEVFDVVNLLRETNPSWKVDGLACVGHLFWRRHLALDDPDGIYRHVALVAFSQLVEVDRHLIPDPLRIEAATVTSSSSELTLLASDVNGLCDFATWAAASKRDTDTYEVQFLVLGSALAMVPASRSEHGDLMGWLAILHFRAGNFAKGMELLGSATHSLLSAPASATGTTGKAWMLSQLGEILKTDPSTLDPAIALAERAVALESDDSFPAGAHHNLSGLYLKRFTHAINSGGKPDAHDLVGALEHGQTAVTILGQARDRAFGLHAAGFAQAIIVRADLDDDPAMLGLAEHHLRLALDNVQDDYPDLDMVLFQMGRVAERRFRWERSRPHLSEAVRCYNAVISSAAAEGQIRAEAQRALGKLPRWSCLPFRFATAPNTGAGHSS